MKHFKLTNETTTNIFGVTLYRIELTIDCKWGKVGDKGGFVEKESNLDDAWVSGNARVYGDAWGKSPLQIQGTRHFFTVSSKTHISIGCHSKTFKEWEDTFESVGKAEGYTPEEIAEYGLYIQLAIKLYKP